MTREELKNNIGKLIDEVELDYEGVCCGWSDKVHGEFRHMLALMDIIDEYTGQIEIEKHIRHCIGVLVKDRDLYKNRHDFAIYNIRIAQYEDLLKYINTEKQSAE